MLFAALHMSLPGISRLGAALKHPVAIGQTGDQRWIIVSVK
jgi:hypothetical protein